MYYKEARKKDHCAFNRDLFFQKPISNEDLVKEILKKINGKMETQSKNTNLC
jgi:hypothetical protein